LESVLGASPRGFESLSLRQEKDARIFRYGHLSSREEKDLNPRFDNKELTQMLASSKWRSFQPYSAESLTINYQNEQLKFTSRMLEIKPSHSVDLF
jgi:hypothetical protein